MDHWAGSTVKGSRTSGNESTRDNLHVTIGEGRKQGSSAQRRVGVTQVRDVSEVREESGKAQGETNQRH